MIQTLLLTFTVRANIDRQSRLSKDTLQEKKRRFLERSLFPVSSVPIGQLPHQLVFISRG